jgi:hypothetical protein
MLCERLLVVVSFHASLHFFGSVAGWGVAGMCTCTLGVVVNDSV